MLAIIIPFYKLIFFEETLQSLAFQTDHRFKVYIGDDASLEDPGPLLEKYQGKFDFVYFRFDHNLGGTSLVEHWKRCIALTSNEEWLMILGDDDILSNKVVEAFYENLEDVKSFDSQVIRFSSAYIYGNGYKKSVIEQHLKVEKATEAYYQHYLELKRSSLSEYIFSREAYSRHYFSNFPLAWHSDDMAWLDFSEGKYIYGINNAYVEVRISEQSISGQNDNIELKKLSRSLFLRAIISNKKLDFKPYQKASFLLDYGVLIKEQKNITMQNVCWTLWQFLKISAFYDALRFLSRMYKARFLNK